MLTWSSAIRSELYYVKMYFVYFSILNECNAQEYAYLHDLLNVFPQLEEQHKQDSLTELYDICHLICGLIERMWRVVDLGYEDLVGELFADDNFSKFIGIMECMNGCKHGNEQTSRNCPSKRSIGSFSTRRCIAGILFRVWRRRWRRWSTNSIAWSSSATPWIRNPSTRSFPPL